SLEGLRGIDKESLDFFVVHSLFDIAGAAGAVDPQKSLTITDSTWHGIRIAIGALNRLHEGSSPRSVYENYIQERAASWGLDASKKVDWAITRLALMLRSSSTDQVAEIKAALMSLPKNTHDIL